MRFSLILLGLSWLLQLTALRNASFRARLKQKTLIAQIKIADDSRGRIFTFTDGKIRSKAGIHPDPDICMAFKDISVAVQLLMPPVDYQQQIDAQKEFNLTMTGDDQDTYWFAQTIMQTQTINWKFGKSLLDGTKIFTSNTNGGPIQVVSLFSRVSIQTGGVDTTEKAPCRRLVPTVTGALVMVVLVLVVPS